MHETPLSLQSCVQMESKLSKMHKYNRSMHGTHNDIREANIDVYLAYKTGILQQTCGQGAETTPRRA